MKSKFAAMVVVGVTMLTMVISACMPPEATPEEIAAREKARKDSVRKANASKCMKHLSFATEYYKNKSYDDALLNYHKLFDYECVDEKMARMVYVYVGNAYRDTDRLDSALIYYDEGLTILPDERSLWESKIFVLKMMGDEEALLDGKVAMFAQFPDDLNLGEEIAEDYIRMDRYDEALELVDQLIGMSPDNKNLTNMKREIVEATGGDVIGFLETEYAANPENIPNAIELANELMTAGNTERAIQIFENVLTLSPDMTNVMKRLVDAYMTVGNTKKVIDLLKKLNTANPDNISYYYDMTDAYILDGQLKSAMTWANKAIDMDKNNGQSYANRAKVFEAVAQGCSGSVPDFDDKLVFMMAYEDYSLAKSKGYGKVNNKIDFLKEARIPQSSDWFFNKEDYVKGGKAAPKKDCYSWLGRKVTAPKN